MALLLIFICIISCNKNDTSTPVFLKYPCNETGIIKDFSGLDGCGYVIKLSSGEIIEPKFVDDSTFVFVDSLPVSLSYQVVSDYNSICIVGPIVRITCITELCSTGIQDFGFFYNPNDYPQDGFAINNVEIISDCIEIEVSYSGGCEEHEFILGVVWPECGTPPVPPPGLFLCHNANNDNCEAYITEIRQFDLSLLQQQDSNATSFTLYQNIQQSTWNREFVYHY